MTVTEYENIIILDDDGRNCWCKHAMIQMQRRHKVNFILLEVSEFRIWKDVCSQFRQNLASGRIPLYKPKISQRFYSLIAAKTDKDGLFLHFRTFLNLLHQNRTDALKRFAVPVLDMDSFNILTPLMWWKWFMFKSTQDLLVKLAETPQH